MRNIQSSQRSLKEDSTPRRLQCDQCIYTTKNISDLRRHERRHNDVKYPCDVCNMPFMTLGHLGGHKRSAHSIDVARQSSERRRVCGQCDYTTAHASDMAKHKRKHEINDYHCQTCNYPFGHETTLNVHINKYHDNHDPEDGQCLTVKKDKNQLQHDVESWTKSSSGSKNNLEKRYPVKHLSRRPNDVKQQLQLDSCSDRENSRRRENLDNCGDNPDRYDTMASRYKADKSGIKEATECMVNRIETSRDLHNSPLGARMKHDLKGHRNQSTGDHRSRHGVNVVKEDLSGDLGLSENDSSRDLNSSKSHQSSVDGDDDFEDQNFEHTGKVYSCKHCAFRTSDLAAFRRHNDRHSKGQFRCSTCHMPFLFKTNLDRHLKNKHSNSTESSSDSSFETITDDSQETLKCSLCPFITFSFKQLDTHSKQHDLNVDKDTVSNGVDDINQDVNAPEECYSFEDKEQDLQFVLDIADDLRARRIPEKDKPYSKNADPGSKENQNKSLVDKKRMRDIDNKETTDGDRQSKDNNTIGGVERSDTNRPETTVPVEEYTCIKCNYVTFDKKFMNLHTTMHGYLFRSPKKLNCKVSIDSTVLGYKTRVVHLSKDKLPPSDQNSARYYKTLFDVVNSSNDTSEPKRSSSMKHLPRRNQSGYSGEKIDSVNECDKSKKVVKGLSDTPGTLNESNSKRTKDTKPTFNTSTNSTTIPNLKQSVANSAQQIGVDKTCNSSVSTSPESVTSSNLLGRVTKEEFKRSRTFYKVDQTTGFPVYECKICEKGNKFVSKTELYHHFKRLHEKIRRQICSTCKYCSGPFPKLD